MGGKPPAGEILIMQGYVTSLAVLEHRTMEMSTTNLIYDFRRFLTSPAHSSITFLRTCFAKFPAQRAL